VQNRLAVEHADRITLSTMHEGAGKTARHGFVYFSKGMVDADTKFQAGPHVHPCG
jgi:hypothetical protein